MVVRGRGTPAGRDETPHSTGSLLAPPSRPERTRHPGTLCVSYRTMWAHGAAARIGPRERRATVRGPNRRGPPGGRRPVRAIRYAQPIGFA